MYTQSALVALVASLSAVSAAVNGFNYGSTDSGGNAVSQQGFVTLFNAAKQIAGSSFTSARLYTMIVRSIYSRDVGFIADERCSKARRPAI